MLQLLNFLILDVQGTERLVYGNLLPMCTRELSHDLVLPLRFHLAQEIQEEHFGECSSRGDIIGARWITLPSQAAQALASQQGFNGMPRLRQLRMK